MKKLKMLGIVGLLSLMACQAGTGNSADSNKAAEQKIAISSEAAISTMEPPQRGIRLDFSHESNRRTWCFR